MQTQTFNNHSFDEIIQKCQQIKSQISNLEQMSFSRAKKFETSIGHFRNYIKKQNDVLDRNIRHCQQRNKWYRQEIDVAWKNAIANRSMILRTVARTNVLKRDLDEWLNKIHDSALVGENNASYISQSRHQDNMQGSQLMQKYNDILKQYGHRL